MQNPTACHQTALSCYPLGFQWVPVGARKPNLDGLFETPASRDMGMLLILR